MKRVCGKFKCRPQLGHPVDFRREGNSRLEEWRQVDQAEGFGHFGS